MSKIDMNKIRGNFSGVEAFTKKHFSETLTAVAILIAAVSSWGHFFIGTMGWSLLFVSIGAILSLFFPKEADKVFRKLDSLSIGGKKIGTLPLEIGKIALALFVPFVYFALVGAMGGTAFHYYAYSIHKKEDQGK